MRKLFRVLAVVVVMVVTMMPVYCAAEQAPLLSTTQLVEDSYVWDGEIVFFKGEVLQDVMQRPSGLWMNLSDGNNTAMGIFVPSNVEMPKISYLESYRTTGDTVLVMGVFHRSCPEHQGETDIHAVTVTVVTPGATRENPIQPRRIAWLLGLLALFALVLYRYLRPPVSRAPRL